MKYYQVPRSPYPIFYEKNFFFHLPVRGSPVPDLQNQETGEHFLTVVAPYGKSFATDLQAVSHFASHGPQVDDV